MPAFKGRLSDAQMDEALSALTFELEGRLWTIGANSGKWYASQGDGWIEAAPPGTKKG